MSMPMQRIPFGSLFPVDCEFTLHSKHVRLRSITLAVVEKYNFRLSPTAAQVTLNMLSVRSSKSCTVFKETHAVNPDSGLVSCTGTEWCMRVPVCLPQSLDLCSQSMTTRAIKISHTLLVTAEFEDKDGKEFDTVCLFTRLLVQFSSMPTDCPDRKTNPVFHLYDAKCRGPGWEYL